MAQSNIHWPYFLSLESDLDSLSRCIEIDERNFSVFSVELTRLFLTTCAEIDAVMKELCELLSPGCSPKNIVDYRKIIKDGLPGFINQETICSKYGLRLTPWQAWGEDQSPEWWQHHNDVKHRRSEHFEKANLANVLHSMAALYSVNIQFNHHLVCHNSRFPEDLCTTLRMLPRNLDLFRIDSPFAYLID